MQATRVPLSCLRGALVNKLLQLWDGLRSSLWFIPSLIVLGTVVLAVALIETDSYGNRESLSEEWPRLFGAGAAGARGLLAAIASSMITVAGVTFSITIVALALASSQYTSRILRNFMRDRANQTVLGAFVGVFAYCLIVLRTIRGGDEGVFVPAVAVFVAVLLAFVAIGFFIFFIHHVAESIQASSIIEAAAEETLRAVDRLFPAEVGEAPAERVENGDVRDLANRAWAPIPARKTGYIQRVDANALFDVARAFGAVVRMEKGIGEFIIDASPLVSVTGQLPDEAFIRKLNATYTIGRHRTIDQDAAFGIRQSWMWRSKRFHPASTTPPPRSFASISWARSSRAWPPVRLKRHTVPMRSGSASSPAGRHFPVCWQKRSIKSARTPKAMSPCSHASFRFWKSSLGELRTYSGVRYSANRQT